jgi:hypothetical protein
VADVLALLMVRKFGVGEQIHIINQLRGGVNPSLPPVWKSKGDLLVPFLISICMEERWIRTLRVRRAAA